METQSNYYDYIIIGAGVGSLTFAAMAARKKKKVLVLERYDQVGGYATAFKRKGFNFEVSLHQIGGVHKTRVKKILEDAGVYHRLTFMKHAFLTELQVAETGEVIKIPNGDGKKAEQMLIDRYPDESKGIKRWFRFMRGFGMQVKRFEHGMIHPVLEGIFMAFMPLFAPLLVLSSVFPFSLAWCLKKLHSSQVKNIINHFSLYYGTPENRLNAQLPMIANYGYYYDGGYYIQGGGQALCQALVKVIKENGSEVITKAGVQKIMVQNNQAVGVKARTIADPIYGKNIIAGANPFHIYRDLLTDWQGSKQALQQIEKLEVSMTASVLYLGLNVPIETLNPALKHTYEYSIVNDMPETEMYNRFQHKQDFEGDYSKWVLTLTVQSHMDPTCLPQENFSCINLFIPDNFERWNRLDKSAYRKQKKIESEKLLIELEKILPGIRNHIVCMELGTPKTMKKFTHNEKGALYGFSQNLYQAGMFRRFKPRSKLKNLYFCSAWTQPGGGYEGAIRSADWLFHRSPRVSLAVMLAVIVASFWL